MLNTFSYQILNTIKTTALLFSILFLISGDLAGQKSLWNEVQFKDIDIRSDWSGNFNMEKVKFFQTEFEDLQNELSNVPMELESNRINFNRSQKTIEIPMPDGRLTNFVISESPSMEEELRLKYPGIRSYKGINMLDSKEVIRFDIGPYGFHGLVFTNKGMVQIDPYNLEDKTLYVTYYTEDYQSDTYSDMPLCGVDHEEEIKQNKALFGMQRFDHEPMLLRQYRLAMACTPTWASSRGTVEKCLADMNTMVNRANLIYEKELAVRMVLIAKNDQIIFLDASTNPYTNTDQGRELIGQNTQVLNQRIGVPAYDIGHVLSRCFDVGGIASLGSICSQGKGAGVTCHNNSNLESIVTRVMTHEMGHQMAASHTFSSCGQTDQLALGTAFEPGSGSTIMSYAGGCGTDNVVGNNDDYYHVGSLDQMLSYTNWTNTDAFICATKIDISNTTPTANINLTGGFTIPKFTPFELTGEAIDLEGDPLTFVWEQFDPGGPNPYNSDPVGNVPIFRSLKPSPKITRFFPNETRILSNRLYENEEKLPTYTRHLTFRFVVRDNNPLGGAVNWEQIKFFVTEDAGPFKMIFPLFDEKFEVGQKINVQWDVANTDKAPVNCKRVNIYLSINEELKTGNPNLVPLALNVENDGEELVILPNYVTNKARIVIKAVDNIFLTTGIFPSIISAATRPSFFMQVLDNQREACLPTSMEFEFETEGLGGLTELIQFEVVSGLPNGAVATFSKNAVNGGEKAILFLDMQNVKGSNYYEVVVRSFVPGIDTLERKLYITLSGTDLDFLTPLVPDNGLTGAAQIQNYKWASKIDAEKYEFQLATNPSFFSDKLVINTEVTDTFYKSNLILDRSSIYYWRSRAINHCRNGEWSEVFAFNTEVSSCFTTSSGILAINISGSGTPTIEGSLFVSQDNIITDINIKKIRGDQERTGDITAYLISPQNTELLLWSQKCGTSKGFFIGLDDEAIDFFKCPINTGKVYRPENKLEKFIGESSKGIWKVRIEDEVPGEGGRFQEFNLEICTNITLDPPSLLKNNGLLLPRLTTKNISSLELLAEDNNTTSDKVTYTLVKRPVYGYLEKNGVIMGAGAQFTQAELNAGTISYRHEWGLDPNDHFTFTVADGEGGWIPVTVFNIQIDQTSSSEELNIARDLKVYPNPTSGMVTVFLNTPFSESLDLNVYDLHGRTVLQTKFNNRMELDLSEIRSGVYIIQVTILDKVIQKKLVKN